MFMRLEIRFYCNRELFSIPLNYNYLFHQAFEDAFRKWEVEEDFRLPYENFISARPQKPQLIFSFSKLNATRTSVQNNVLFVEGICKIILSAPVPDDKVDSFVHSLWSNKSIKLINGTELIELFIKSIRREHVPQFEKREKFLMMSPTTVSKYIQNSNTNNLHFLRVTDNDVESLLAFRLRRRYEIVNTEKYSGNLHIEIDREYVKQKGGSEAISKLITINQGTPHEMKIKSFLCPVTIEAMPDMMEFAYISGLGERTEYGFGMLESIKYKDLVREKTYEKCNGNLKSNKLLKQFEYESEDLRNFNRKDIIPPFVNRANVGTEYDK